MGKKKPTEEVGVKIISPTRPGPKEKVTPDLLQEILIRISNGESERAIIESDHMPSWNCWCEYKMRHISEIGDHYALAKESGFKAWEFEMLKRAKDESRDLQPDGKGGMRSDNTFVNRDRLVIDTMKWQMSKQAPKIYGEKFEQQLTGKDGAGLSIVVNITKKQAETN